jgi:hypothetical protein
MTRRRRRNPTKKRPAARRKPAGTDPIAVRTTVLAAALIGTFICYTIVNGNSGVQPSGGI